MLQPAPNLRSEVLRLAVPRDPAFGGVLIARLDEAKDQDSESVPQRFDATEPKLAVAKRLEAAYQLLEAGDLKQAKEFASPALDYVTSPGIIFLCALRQKEALSADDLYAGLLTHAGTDPRTDATTVSYFRLISLRLIFLSQPRNREG